MRLLSSVFAAALGAVAVTISASAAESASCSKAAARQALPRAGLPADEGIQGVVQVLCGPFAGHASHVMVALYYGPGNTGPIDWVAYRLVGGTWQPAVKRHEAAVLTAAGLDFKTTMNVYRANDPRCCPSGGTRSRIWHWNGSTFTSTAWKYSTSQTTKPNTMAPVNFVSPSRNLQCEMSDNADSVRVRCQSIKRPHSVILTAKGRLTICRPSPTRDCLGNYGENAKVKVLGYGRSLTVGRFRCRSSEAGITCVVIASGKGFHIDKDTVRPIGK